VSGPTEVGTGHRTEPDAPLLTTRRLLLHRPQDNHLDAEEASCNLVLANDTVTRLSMVVTPEEARYHVTTDRDEALRGLVEMAYLRSHLTFTRSTVVAGEPVPWDSPLVPDSLRKVVNYCIRRGAYKPFRGGTAGHFAVKLDASTFLTSRRKTDFNNLARVGLVKVVTDGFLDQMQAGDVLLVRGSPARVLEADRTQAREPLGRLGFYVRADRCLTAVTASSARRIARSAIGRWPGSPPRLALRRSRRRRE
jgi:hypothetical protein